jgi:hypothetical protein
MRDQADKDGEQDYGNSEISTNQFIDIKQGIGKGGNYDCFPHTSHPIWGE